MANLILPLLLFGGMYMLLIRPQQQKLKAHQETIARAKAGDRVLLSSGVYGTVTEVLDVSVYVEIAEGIEILVARPSIQDIIDDFPTDAASVQDSPEVEA